MSNLRVLIYSATFGSGHIRAAEAIIDEIRDKAPGAEIIHEDYGAFVNRTFNTLLKSTYIKLIKHTPSVWGRFYYKTANIPPHSTFQSFLNKLGRKQLLRHIEMVKPDFIVTTYPTVAGVLGELRQNGTLNVPLVTVVTDYVVHSQWIHPGVDLYIVGSKEIYKGFVLRGIDPKRIKVTGIPVSPKFERKLNREEILAKLGLNPGLPTLLIMGGAYGVLNEARDVCKITAFSKVPVQSVIVCGRDKKLYKSLDDIIAKSRNPIKRFGFVNNVEELMTVSDLIVTKAGGLTVSEALTKHLPLVIFKPIPGQEELNTVFLNKIGAGRSAENIEELTKLIYHLLNNPGELAQMRSAAAQALPGHAVERAVEYMLQLVKIEKEAKIG